MDHELTGNENRGRRRRWAFLVPLFGAAALGLAVVAVVEGPDGDERLVAAATAESTGGEALEVEGAYPRDRLTPERELLPELPDRADIDAAASEVPEGARQSVWPGDQWSGLPGFEGASAHPVFSNDGDRLVGMMVSGVGIVDIDLYEDPDVDMEELLLDRIGAGEYEERRQRNAEMHSCVDELVEVYDSPDASSDEAAYRQELSECLSPA